MIENFGLIMFCAMIPIVIGVIVAIKNDKKKKVNHILNVIMGAFVGVFIGHGAYVVWNFKTRPELYAMQSAPWYTSILVYGAFTVAVLVVCIVLKAILKHYAKKSSRNSAE